MILRFLLAGGSPLKEGMDYAPGGSSRVRNTAFGRYGPYTFQAGRTFIFHGNTLKKSVSVKGEGTV